MIMILLFTIVVIVIMITIIISALKRKKSETETIFEKEIVFSKVKKEEKKENKKKTSKDIVVTILVWVVLLVFLVIALWAILGLVGEIKKIILSQPSTAVSENLTNSKNYSALNKENRGKEFILYNFSNYSGGRVRVYLSTSGGIWKNFPKGGRIALETDSGRLIGYDEPGIKKNWGYVPDGWYVFRPADSSATGVEIFH